MHATKSQLCMDIIQGKDHYMENLYQFDERTGQEGLLHPGSR